MNIKLKQAEYEELLKLEDGQTIDVTYKGISAFITPDPYGNIEYDGRRFTFNFYCPSEVKMVVKKEKYKTIIGVYNNPSTYHPYVVKTSGRHPVRIVDDGDVITEYDGDDVPGDVGWFWLNELEYALFKKNCKEILI